MEISIMRGIVIGTPISVGLWFIILTVSSRLI
jgi:hypothetical protein